MAHNPDQLLMYRKFRKAVDEAKEEDHDAILFLLEFMEGYFEDNVPVEVLIQCAEFICEKYRKDLNIITESN